MGMGKHWAMSNMWGSHLSPAFTSKNGTFSDRINCWRSIDGDLNYLQQRKNTGIEAEDWIESNPQCCLTDLKTHFGLGEFGWVHQVEATKKRQVWLHMASFAAFCQWIRLRRKRKRKTWSSTSSVRWSRTVPLTWDSLTILFNILIILYIYNMSNPFAVQIPRQQIDTGCQQR